MSVNVQTSNGLQPIAGYSKNDKLVHLILSYPDDVVGKVIYISNGMESYEVEAVEGGMIVDCKNLGQWLIEEPDNDILLSVDTTFYGNYEVEVEKKFNIWLRLGRVSREFSSLEEILADQTTLRQLMTIHASADYMIEWLQNDNAFRSTLLASDNALKWIGLRDYTYDKLPSDFISEWLSGQYWERALKDHVPVMTSNTAPYGEVYANGELSQYQKWKAFGGLNETASNTWAWQGNGTNTAWLGYKFTNPMCIEKVFLENRNEEQSRAIKSFIIQGSNDGNTWNNITNELQNKGGDIPKGNGYYDIEKNNYYLYFRLFAKSVYDTSYTGIGKLQFYGRSLNVSVPAMTSDTAPYGTLIYSAYRLPSGHTYNPYNAFDKDSSTYWQAYQQGTENWIGYSFTSKKLCKYVYFDLHNSFNGILYIEGSNDNSKWDILYQKTFTASQSEINPYLFNLSTNVEYKTYRARMQEIDGGSLQDIDELDFFCVDYSEREFAEGSTIKYLYDHGIELEELIDAVTSGEIFIKENDQMYFKRSTNANTVYVYALTTDLSAKKLIRFEFGNKIKMGSNNTNGRCSVWTDSATAAQVSFTNNSPNYLNISSLNEIYTVALGCFGADANSELSITEWWLE